MEEAGKANGEGAGKGVYIALGLFVLALAGGATWYFTKKKAPDGGLGSGVKPSDKGSDPGVTPDGKKADAQVPDAVGAKAGSAGNDYVTGDAVDKRNSKKYDGYGGDAVANQADWNQSIMDNMGYTPHFKQIDNRKKRNKKRADAQQNVNQVDRYVKGFMKGMNLSPRADYVAIFAPFIKTYLSNPAKLSYDSVSVGQFLK